jgi:dUTP pyrophosphatase
MMIETGLCFVIPDGFWLKLRERSGLANKGIHVLGGVIDSGYTGCVKVIVFNSNKEPVYLPKDKAICQFTVERLNVSTVEEIGFGEFCIEEDKRTRRGRGFGSTDVQPNK